MHSAPYKTLAERLQWVKEDPVQSPWMEVSLSQGKTRFTPLKSEFGLKSKTQRHKLSPTHLTDQETLYLLFAIQTNVTCTLSANKIINPALIFIAGNAKSMNPHPPPPKWFFGLKLNLQHGLQSSQKKTLFFPRANWAPTGFLTLSFPCFRGAMVCISHTDYLCRSSLLCQSPSSPLHLVKVPLSPSWGTAEEALFQGGLSSSQDLQKDMGKGSL